MTFALRFETVCSNHLIACGCFQLRQNLTWHLYGRWRLCTRMRHVRLFSLGILDKLHVPTPYDFSLKQLQSLGFSRNSFLLWDQKVHSTLPLDPTLRQLKPVQTFVTTSSNISFHNTLNIYDYIPQWHFF